MTPIYVRGKVCPRPISLHIFKLFPLSSDCEGAGGKPTSLEQRMRTNPTHTSVTSSDQTCALIRSTQLSWDFPKYRPRSILSSPKKQEPLNLVASGRHSEYNDYSLKRCGRQSHYFVSHLGGIGVT